MRFIFESSQKKKQQRIVALADACQLEIYKTAINAIQDEYEPDVAGKVAAGIANYIMQFGHFNEAHSRDALLSAQIELELARCARYFTEKFQQNILGCIILLAALQQVPLSKYVEHIRNLHKLNLFALGARTPDVSSDLSKKTWCICSRQQRSHARNCLIYFKASSILQHHSARRMNGEVFLRIFQACPTACK